MPARIPKRETIRRWIDSKKVDRVVLGRRADELVRERILAARESKAKAAVEYRRVLREKIEERREAISTLTGLNIKDLKRIEERVKNGVVRERITDETRVRRAPSFIAFEEKLINLFRAEHQTKERPDYAQDPNYRTIEKYINDVEWWVREHVHVHNVAREKIRKGKI